MVEKSKAEVWLSEKLWDGNPHSIGEVLQAWVKRLDSVADAFRWTDTASAEEIRIMQHELISAARKLAVEVSFREVKGRGQTSEERAFWTLPQ